MKRKSILIIGILAIFSFVFILSGCDEILEAFYPDYAKNAGGNEIRVDVDIDPGLANWDVRVYGRVESADLDPGEPDYFSTDMDVPIDFSQYDDQGNPIPKAFLDFFGIPGSEDRPRSYRVLVWLDMNKNGQPDPGEEPVAFARWNDDPNDPKATTEIFSFPNQFRWSTVTGNVFLGGKAVDLNFYFSGQFALGTTPGTIYYDFWPEDSERRITDVSWDVTDSTGAYVMGGDTPFDSVDGGSLEIDYSSLSVTGWYNLKVTVVYEDGNALTRRFPVLFSDEAEDGTLYTLYLNLTGLNDDPLRLAGDKLYRYLVYIMDYNFGVVNQFDEGYLQTDPDGNVYISVSGLSYHNVTAGSGGNYWVGVVIDLNDDGVAGQGDFFASMPISLELGNGELNMDIDSWDFYPVFQ